MNKTLVSLLLFVASAMGKGRGGGGSSIGSIDDGWDAPGLVKAYFAFQIIWAIIALVQLIYILKNLSALPSMAARGPYLLLALCTLCLMLYNVLIAVYYRLDDVLDNMPLGSIQSAANFFWGVDASFRPMVVLYLIHRRGDVLRALKANTVTPLSTYTWKRILDWVLTALTFVMYTATMAVIAMRLEMLYGTARYDSRQSAALSRARVGLTNTGLAFVLLLYINLIVSTIVQFVQGKGTSRDLVTSRLLKIIVPLFTLYLVETLAFNIYSQTHVFKLDEGYTYNLVITIIDGGLTVAITAALILTMTIPGVQWSPETVVPEVAPPPFEKQWATPNSGSTQPLAPNAGWGQPVYYPQHQSQFYPAPHPMFQQQPQYPYSPPMQPASNQTSPYSPPTQPPPMASPYSPPTQPPPMQPAQH